MRKPGSARTMVTLTEAFWMSVTTLALILSAGCYKPNIAPGTLTCSPSGKPCPDGFECGPNNLCFRAGAVGLGGSMGSGGASGGGGIVGSGGAGDQGGAAGLGQGGGDDLGGMGGVSGLGAVGAMGGVGGFGGAAGQPLRKVGETCLIMNETQPDQSDNCVTGALCLGGDCMTARCYQICLSDAQCPQSACTRVSTNGLRRLCELPFVTCNPSDTTTGGCGEGLGCYLLSADARPSGDGDRTVCDCPMPAVGPAEACSDSRGCFKGLVCPPPGSGPGARYCRRLCDPATGCSSGSTCHPFGAKWGYCF